MSAGGLLPGVLERLVEAGLEQFHGRQFGEIFADADGFGIEFEEFHLLGVGGGTEDEADGGFLAGGAIVLVEPAEVELHLPDVGGLEGFELQLDGDQPAEISMVEQQVEMEIVLADAHALLPGDEGEARPEFQEDAFHLAEDRVFEVPLADMPLSAPGSRGTGIAKDEIGSHPTVAEVGDLRGDDLLGVPGQGRALEQHAADLLPECPDIPALDAAHLGVEVAGERVLEGRIA